MQPHCIGDQKQINLVHPSIGAEWASSLPVDSLKSLKQEIGPQQHFPFNSASLLADRRKTSFPYENSLFSSSLSENFSRKCKIVPLPLGENGGWVY